MSININLLFVIVLLSLSCCIESTNVQQCRDESQKSFDTIQSVDISSCNYELPCQLKKSTTVHVEQVFIPTTNVQDLVTSVYATINGVPFPFIGVNGYSACNEIFNIDGTPAGCQLTAYNTYVYRNSFPIYGIYPEISLTVYWALKEKNDVLTCYEVPARITSNS